MSKKKSKKQASKKSRSKKISIVCVIIGLLVVIATALLVMQFCTPYKPSNGFKRVTEETEQTLPSEEEEQTPADENNNGELGQ